MKLQSEQKSTHLLVWYEMSGGKEEGIEKEG